MSIPEQSAAPVPSPVLGAEIQIDRRSAPRTGPAAAPPPPAKPASPSEESWMMEPGESPHPKPSPKPAAKPVGPPRPAAPPTAPAMPAAPRPAVPPPPASPFAAAAPKAAVNEPAAPPAPAPNKKAITGKFGWPEARPGAAAPAPAAAPTVAAAPKPAAPAPAPVAAAAAPAAQAAPTPPAPEPLAAKPAPEPERRDEMMSAGKMRELAPEPEFEKAPLPRVDAPSEPPLSREKLVQPAEAPSEPGAPSQPPTPAASPEPALEEVSSPPARSMAVRSAELPTEAIHAEPGGALAQIGAGLVDAALVGLLFFACLLVAQAIAGKVPASDETGIDWLIERTLTWRHVLLPGVGFLGALWFVYGSLFHALGGKTLGKRLFGLTVVDETGQPPRLTRSAARSLLSFASAALLMMGYVLVLFDARRQALHDKLAHTFVVRLAD